MAVPHSKSLDHLGLVAGFCKDINLAQIIDKQVIGLVQLNLPELTSGLYIVEMTEANGTPHTQQLIVR